MRVITFLGVNSVQSPLVEVSRVSVHVCYKKSIYLRLHSHVVISRDVRKTEIRFRFGFQKPYKNMTSMQTVFRQKLHAICHSNKSE